MNWFKMAFYLLYFSSVALAAPARNECANPPSGTIFCEDFEGVNPKGNFDDFDGNSDTENLIVTEPGPSADPANKAIRLRAPAGVSGGSDLLKVLPSTHDKLYVRWYVKYETGFNFVAPNHGGGLAAGDRSFVGSSGNKPNGADFAGFYVQYQVSTAVPFAYSYYPGMYQDCGAQGSCFGDSLPCVYDAGGSYCIKPQHLPSITLPTVQAGQWYCVEQMVDMGTPTPTETSANGRLTLWLDGVELTDPQDLWIRTTANLKLQNLWVNLYHHDGTHSVGGEFVDNLAVSTQRIDCGPGQPVGNSVRYDLIWTVTNAPSVAATHYRIDESVNGVWVPVATVPAAQLTYSITGRPVGGTAVLSVMPLNTGVPGIRSNASVCGTVVTGPKTTLIFSCAPKLETR